MTITQLQKIKNKEHDIETDIINHIKARQYKSKCYQIKTQKHLEIQIDDMNNDINQIKKSLKEIFSMIQAIYEFEDC